MPSAAVARARSGAARAHGGREAWLFPLIVALGLRVLDSVVAGIADTYFPANTLIESSDQHVARASGALETLVGAFTRYDVLWYVKIAWNGYGWNHQSAAFFPLYPAALAAIADPLRLDIYGMTALGALVSTVAFAAGLMFLYRLLALDYPRDIVRVAIIILALFPSSFAYMIPYTESLFLLLSVAALYFARKDRWQAAGICVFLATACRLAGLLVLIPIGIRWWMTYRKSWRANLGKLAWMALAPLAFLAVLEAQFLSTGVFPAALVEQNKWRVPEFPYTPLLYAWVIITTLSAHIQSTDPGAPTYYLNVLHNQLDLAGGIFLVLVSVAGLFTLSLDYAFYLVISVAFYLSNNFKYSEPLAALMRYAGICFPLYLVLAEVASRGRVRTLLLAVLCVAFLAWHIYWLGSFVTWNWVV